MPFVAMIKVSCGPHAAVTLGVMVRQDSGRKGKTLGIVSPRKSAKNSTFQPVVVRNE